MEVKVVYSDYSREVKSATIDLSNGQCVEINYIEDIVNKGTQSEIKINKLEVKYIDDTTSLEISNQMTLDEVIKYISLLQRFAKQL